MAGKTKWRDKTKLAGINKMAEVKWWEMLNKRAERERWHVEAHLFKIWREVSAKGRNAQESVGEQMGSR
jgi:hypothetical protein